MIFASKKKKKKSFVLLFHQNIITVTLFIIAKKVFFFNTKCNIPTYTCFIMTPFFIDISQAIIVAILRLLIFIAILKPEQPYLSY